MSSSSQSSHSSYYRSSASSATASHHCGETHATSILDGHVPPKVPLAVFDTALLGARTDGLQDFTDKVSVRYTTLARDLVDSTDIMVDITRLLNGISQLYQEHYKLASDQRVEFIEHSHTPLIHHPRKSTVMRPPLIAVSSRVAQSYLSCHRDGDAPDVTAVAWHHVMAAIYIDGGAEDCHLADRCASFLGALNQARPDMSGSFALTTTRGACSIFWSDAAEVCSSHPAAWTESTTLASIARFVHRLYAPFAVDCTVQLEHGTPPHVGAAPAYRSPAEALPKSLHGKEPVWLVQDDGGVEYRISAVLDVGKPWTHRNWVAATTQRRAVGAKEFTDCPRMVIKDCWSTMSREDVAESAILEHIHADGEFPGVCRVLSSFRVPGSYGTAGYLESVYLPDVQGDRLAGRRKHRLLLDGTGKDLYACSSVADFLIVMYDAIDVLRQLHERRGILHRDISIRNILLAPDNAGRQSDAKAIQDVLSYKYPFMQAGHGPRCVLIDFDNAFWKDKMSESSLQTAVGTPAFVARSVSHAFLLENQLPPRPILKLGGSAKECYLHAYGEERYNAQSSLHDHREMLSGEAPEERRLHAPRHDVESCFFVILHFLITALPAGADPSDDPNVTSGKLVCNKLESARMGDISDLRFSLFNISGRSWTLCLHPSLHGFGRLLASLAGVVQPLYELCEEELPPYHLHEAVQRILLAEMCRVLDANEDVALDTHRRRAVDSVYDGSPLWLLPDGNPAPDCSSRKRQALSLVRSGSGPRRRLS